MALFYFCLLLLFGSSLATSIHGVSLEKASFYVPGKSFTCLDGSDTIPFKYVNDDYCDCADGSDEPGTSACPDNLFYCPNKGHKASYLLSSRVNDKICDCCDGSDEWGTDTTCTNTCEEMGRAAKAELQRRFETHAQGYEKMLEYSRQGEEKKSEYQKELEQYENDIGVIESEIETLRQAKDDAEDPETKAKDEHKNKWEESINTHKAAKREVEARKMFMLLDADSDGRVTTQEVMNHSELDDNGDNVVTLEEANHYLDEAESVDFETFLERVWDAMAANIAKREEERLDAERAKKEEEKAQRENEEGDEKKDEDDDDDDDEDNGDNKDQDSPPSVMPPYDEETQKLIETADKARKDLEEAESRKRDIEGKRNERQKYLNIDFGDNQQFAPLYQQCYEFTDREYTYKLCMFDKVTQRNKNGGSETRLGEWDKWDGPPNTSVHSVMHYSNGEKCWNGPNRSTLVTLVCGVEEKVLSAGEPNKCEYAMEFSTPAFCLEKRPARLHTEL
uniref:Glucosidase 2 subunit beta n=1 Tax=Amphimedon queenslandica TaxID=400682 RepID=A0A1X7TLQ0_AMPQE